jgi:retron-type reverse transcriptase
MKERPKVNNRHGLMKFRILQHLEKCGERRNRSTTSISRKGSSLVRLAELELSGSCESQHLLKLKSDVNNGLKVTNLSVIMSDPNFLIACWVRIRSNKNSLTPVFDGNIGGIKKSWFKVTAGQIGNGNYKFQAVKKKYISKSNNAKLRSLPVPSFKDKIVQEGIRFLLNAIFEPFFKDSSYGRRPDRGCLTALNDIRMKCKSSSWYVEGSIEQQFSPMNHQILMSTIKTKVDDQAFLDLLYKYLKVGYEENIKLTTSMKIGVTQRETLSSILANIYMHPLDEWVESSLKSNFDKRAKRTKNPEYFRKYCRTELKIKDESI